MKSSQLSFNNTRFSPSEFPPGVLDQMDSRVILALFDLRNSLPNDCAIFPSPLVGAHVRQTGTSRHSTNNGLRLSDATDFFVHRRFARQVWFEILKSPDINGIGCYQHSFFRNDERAFTMFHIDTRPVAEKAMWVGARNSRHENFTYYSFQNNSRKFFETLSQGGIWE